MPAYVGRSGWVSVAVASTLTPDHMRELIEEAWRQTAPKRLVKTYDADPELARRAGLRAAPLTIRAVYSRARSPALRRVVLLLEHAELVAFGVGQDDPGLLALAYVDATGAERDESGDLSGLIATARIQVDVQTVLRSLRLKVWNENDWWGAHRPSADLHRFLISPRRLPVQYGTPELAECLWVAGINDELGKGAGHGSGPISCRASILNLA